MKNLLFVAVMAISFTVSGNVPSQQIISGQTQINTDPGFSFLRGHKQGNSAYALQWSMTSATGIAYYEIQSTYEDPFDIYSNWTNEGTAQGTRANIVKFTHQSVLPGTISYRVIAILTNGRSNIVSDIYTTTIE
jgi:hypothetical protein